MYTQRCWNCNSLIKSLVTLMLYCTNISCVLNRLVFVPFCASRENFFHSVSMFYKPERAVSCHAPSSKTTYKHSSLALSLALALTRSLFLYIYTHTKLRKGAFGLICSINYRLFGHN